MAYDEGLATRIREVTAQQPGLAEMKMFGGLAFLVHGNMACGVRGDDLIVRVAAEEPMRPWVSRALGRSI
jgi:TfoX N-terminal domain